MTTSDPSLSSPILSRWTQFKDEHEATAAAYLQALKGQQDLLGLILKGHLVVEDMLRRALALHCVEADHLKGTRFKFGQLVSLLRALQKIPVPDDVWEAAIALNRLRNEAAHSLTETKLAELVTIFISSTSIAKNQRIKDLPDVPSAAFPMAIHYLVGQFDMACMWYAGVEALVSETLAARAED
jgi:hypothetical protein